MNLCFFSPSCTVAATTIAPWSTDRTTDDTVKDTDASTQTEIKTGTGSPTVRPRAIIHGNSLRTCTTTDAAERKSGSGPTREKAAGVSTNEGGVKPGPIANPPR